MNGMSGILTSMQVVPNGVSTARSSTPRLARIELHAEPIVRLAKSLLRRERNGINADGSANSEEGVVILRHRLREFQRFLGQLRSGSWSRELVQFDEDATRYMALANRLVRREGANGNTRSRMLRSGEIKVATVMPPSELASDELSCAICLVDYSSIHSPIRLTECCRRPLGQECLMHWLSCDISCPLCRANFDATGRGLNVERQEQPNAVIVNFAIAGQHTHRIISGVVASRVNTMRSERDRLLLFIENHLELQNVQRLEDYLSLSREVEALTVPNNAELQFLIQRIHSQL